MRTDRLAYTPNFNPNLEPKHNPSPNPNANPNPDRQFHSVWLDGAGEGGAVSAGMLDPQQA